MTDISQLPGAFLFDLDGVLTPTLDVHKRAWTTLFDAVLPPTTAPYTEDDYNRLVDGRPRYDGVRNVLESRGIHLPEGTPDDGVQDNTVCGLGNRKDALFNQELGHGMTAYPGSLGLLDYLGPAYRMAVVSSSRNARAVLAAAGLAERFPVVVDGIVAAEHHLAGKPAPDTYLYAARQLGVSPGQAAVVEDALGGVEAGAAGGFGLVVGVDRGAGREALMQHGADIVVDDLAEVIPLVVGCVPANAQNDHPGGSAATPPKEGNEADIPLMVGCVPANAQNDHPGGSAATPPKEGNEADIPLVAGYVPANAQNDHPGGSAATPPKPESTDHELLRDPIQAPWLRWRHSTGGQPVFAVAALPSHLSSAARDAQHRWIQAKEGN